MNLDGTQVVAGPSIVGETIQGDEIIRQVRQATKLFDQALA